MRPKKPNPQGFLEMMIFMKENTDFEKQKSQYAKKGLYGDLIELIEKELLLATSKNRLDYLKIQLAEAYYEKREFQKSRAIVEQLLPGLQSNQQTSLTGEAENLMGKIYRIYQRYDEALDHYRKAEKAFKQVKRDPGLAKVYHNLGNVFIFLGRFKEAKKNHFKALKIIQETEDTQAIAQSYLNIGGLFYHSGEVNEAQNYFEKARTLLDENKDESLLAGVYLNLAETYRIRRDYSAAYENSMKAVALFEKHQKIAEQKVALTSLARIIKEKGDFQKAIEVYQKILELTSPTSDEDILIGLGECFMATHQVQEAVIVFEEVLELPRHTPRGKGHALDHLARIAIDSTNFLRAKDKFTELLDLLHQMDPHDEDSIASTQGNLGFMFLKTGDISHSLELLDDSATYLKRRKYWEELITLTKNYSAEFVRIGEYSNAIRILQDNAIQAAKKSKNSQSQNNYIYEIAFLYHLLGKTSSGLEYWEKNNKKKNTFQKYSPHFIDNTDLDPERKRDLERQHRQFLKQIHQLKSKLQ